MPFLDVEENLQIALDKASEQKLTLKIVIYRRYSLGEGIVK